MGGSGGSGDRRGFLDLLEQLARTREKAVALDDPFRRRVFEPLPAGGLEGRTRAMLKVEDGCTNFCAYCIIPYARGPIRSLPLEEAKAQAAQLAAQSPDPASVLRERVTSKGGTTYAALTTLEDAGVKASFIQAMRAAQKRAGELGDEFGSP